NVVSKDHLAETRRHLCNQLRNDYPSVFSPGLGRCTKMQASLRLLPDSTPTFKKARPVPYASLPRISEEIDRLINSGVLTPTNHSNVAAPIVVIQKKNNTLRLYADYSTGLNNSLENHHYPLPIPEDIFTKLNGGQYFSQIDFSETYLQIEVDDEAKKLLTINTHRGLFTFNRLPFGVKTAPSIF